MDQHILLMDLPTTTKHNIQQVLLPQALLLKEDIIAVANLLTLLLANVKMVPVLAGLTGTAQNV